MDVMRSGIGLRGVAQRDPLVEFKREGYLAFEQLKLAIEHHIVEVLFRAPVAIEVREMPQQALPQNLRTNADQIEAASGQAKGAGAQPPRLPAPANGRDNGRAAAASNGLAAALDRAEPSGDRPAPAPARSSAQPGRSGARPQSAVRPGASGARPVAANAAPGKVGRNDPCPCGSGRKYKMCHGR
jgi:preprotein translocase subunit SecA